MYCSKCGAKLQADTVFCSFCGTKVKASKNVCAECGATLRDDSAFCEKCGAQVGGEKAVKSGAKHETSFANILRKPVAKIVVGLLLMVSVAGIACMCMKSSYAKTLYDKGALCYAANNYKEAKIFFDKSASMGNPDAMYQIGYMCWHGEGVAKNSQEAERWYKKAEKAYLRKIKKGDYQAIKDLFLNLYVLSEEDFGNDDAVVLEPNDSVLNELGKQYIAYLNDEISKENPDAMEMLGNIYSSYATGMKGGIFLRYTEDVSRLDNADNGLEYCQSKASQLYQKALAIYRNRAASGDADAMFNLGCMYYCGQYVQENEAEGMRWLNKASEKGNVEAKCFLIRIKNQ